MFKADMDCDDVLCTLEEVRDHLTRAIEGLKSVTDGSIDRTLIAGLDR